MEKMSDMLKPDIITIMRNEVDAAITNNEFGDRFSKFERDSFKKDLITGLWATFLGKSAIAEERRINGTVWSFVFNSIKGSIVLSVANMKTGATFRYIVNSFDDGDLYDTMDYMRLVMERTGNGSDNQTTKK